jgi:hypothetical protein
MASTGGSTPLEVAVARARHAASQAFDIHLDIKDVDGWLEAIQGQERHLVPAAAAKLLKRLRSEAQTALDEQASNLVFVRPW